MRQLEMTRLRATPAAPPAPAAAARSGITRRPRKFRGSPSPGRPCRRGTLFRSVRRSPALPPLPTMSLHAAAWGLPPPRYCQGQVPSRWSVAPVLPVLASALLPSPALCQAVKVVLRASTWTARRGGSSFVQLRAGPASALGIRFDGRRRVRRVIDFARTKNALCVLVRS
jgi:hypothetical protein